MWLLPDSVTPVEAIWTTLGMAGAAVSAANLRDAFLDRRAVLHLPASANRESLVVMARAGVRLEALRTSKMLAITGVGLLAAATRPPLPPGIHVPVWTPVSTALTAGLFYIVLAVVAQTVLDRRVRKRFYGRSPDRP